MGAYGLAVAAAFAVALAVLVSVSSTSTAEAQTAPGKSAEVQFGGTGADFGSGVGTGATDSIVRFEIDPLSTAMGSFGFNDGQALVCKNNTACDTGRTDATPPAQVDDSIVVKVNVDADSPKGFILVKATGPLPGAQTVAYHSIDVDPGQTPGTLTVKPEGGVTTLDADDNNDQVVLTITLKDTANPSKGIAGEAITLVTTNGVFIPLTGTGEDITGGTAGATACVGTGVVQACSPTTSADASGDDTDDGAGQIKVRFRGSTREGVAEITATHGTSGLTDTVRIVLSGNAKKLSAEADQDSVELGGSVFVVLTVTDSADNPIRGHTDIPDVTSSDITGPSDDARKVTVSTDRDKDPNENRKVDDGDIPACGNDEDASAAEDSTNLTSDGTNDGEDVPAGTNSDGQCVIHVSTSNTKNAETTRGTHTLKFKLSSAVGAATVTVEIAVSGTPTTIDSDAPARIDPLEEVTVNLTVLDDDGVRVGKVYYSVTKISDGGVITSGESGQTSDGRAKFAYLGPEGTAQFLVRTWTKAHDVAGTKQTARAQILIEVAEAMPEEPEEPMPSGDATLSVTGNLGVFSGGSLDDLAAAAGDACPGGAIIGAQADGEWQLWSSSAPDFANIGFTSAFADGLDMQAVWVSSCEADAMDSEGSMGG